MNDKNYTMEFFRMTATTFEGDKALYWAGRMAQSVRMVTGSTPLTLSKNLKLLEQCTDEYDKIIFERAK
jgi:hypothetical protein